MKDDKPNDLWIYDEPSDQTNEDDDAIEALEDEIWREKYFERRNKKTKMRDTICKHSRRRK